MVTALRMVVLHGAAEPLPENMEQAVTEHLRVRLQDGSCLCALLAENGCAGCWNTAAKPVYARSLPVRKERRSRFMNVLALH